MNVTIIVRTQSGANIEVSQDRPESRTMSSGDFDARLIAETRAAGGERGRDSDGMRGGRRCRGPPRATATPDSWVTGRCRRVARRASVACPSVGPRVSAPAPLGRRELRHLPLSHARAPRRLPLTRDPRSCWERLDVLAVARRFVAGGGSEFPVVRGAIPRPEGALAVDAPAGVTVNGDPVRVCVRSIGSAVRGSGPPRTSRRRRTPGTCRRRSGSRTRERPRAECGCGGGSGATVG